MNNIREVNPSPFHPLFAAISRRATITSKNTITDDANSKIALVGYSEKLLQEIFSKSEKSVADYKACREQLKKSYDSMRWLSSECFGKLYAGLELRALLSTPKDSPINLTELNDGIRQNTMFKDALELLNDAKLIELENKYMKARVTNEGREYLLTLK